MDLDSTGQTGRHEHVTTTKPENDLALIGAVERLPMELWSEIVGCFDSDYECDEEECQPTLARLCRTSHAIRAAAEPVLYKRYRKQRPKWCEVRHQDFAKQVLKTRERFYLYLRTLISNPELGKHVRCLALEVWESRVAAESTATWFDREIHGVQLPAIAWDILQEMRFAASNFNLGRLQERWIESLGTNESEDAAVVLLLVLTPNLEDLHFEHPVHGGKPMVCHFLGHTQDYGTNLLDYNRLKKSHHIGLALGKILLQTRSSRRIHFVSSVSNLAPAHS